MYNCGIPSHNHDKGCSPLRILIHNRGDRCRRCHTVGHIYWTCDGSGHHPGSQFKKTQPAKEIFDKGAQDFRNGENCKNDLQLFDDKIAKLEKTVEIMLNEQRESIMLEMKTMNKTLSQKSAENKTSIESLLKNQLINKNCQSKDPLVPDQEGREKSQDLETNPHEKNNLIKTLKEEIKNVKFENRKLTQTHSNNFENWLHQKTSLKESIETKDKDLKKLRHTNSNQQKEIRQLIELLAKLFPEVRNMGDSLNDEVVKTLENLIEKQKQY